MDIQITPGKKSHSADSAIRGMAQNLSHSTK